MTQFQLNITSLVALIGVTALPLTLYASDPISVPWDQVCRVSTGHELLATTASGDTVEGFCVGIDVNEITVRTNDRKVVKIARNTLSRLEMHRGNGHQFRSLRAGVYGNLKWGFDALLSPRMLAGAVAIPGTLAWGAVTTPFCLLGDLKAKVIGMREIHPN